MRPNVEEQGDEIYLNIGDMFPFKLVESISVIFDFPDTDHEYEKELPYEMYHERIFKTENAHKTRP